MKRNMLVFGTIAGVIVAAFMGTSMAIMGCSSDSMDGGSGAMVIGFASMAAAFSFVFVGIKNYRDKQNGGIITFGQGFWLGFMISLIASTIYVATWAVEFHLFMPDFMDKYSAMQIKQLQESGISEVELAKQVKEIETNAYDYKHNPLVFAAYTYMEILPVGIIITLISALILKRKTPVVNG
jgi:Protein of unknown function (DUF4199)